MRSFTTTIYSLFVSHIHSATVALAGLDIQQQIPCVIYTHDYNTVFKHIKDKNYIYQPSLKEFNKLMFQFPNFILGTQTERNKKELGATAYHLPLPLPAPQLLDIIPKQQEGVLFIGRWESRKNPQTYINLIKETNLPARVLCSPNSKKAFEKAFKENNITNYTFALDVNSKIQKRGYFTQEEKANFIAHSKVSFLPYFWESYGLGVLESMTQMPVVLLKKNEWHTNFNSKAIYLADDFEHAVELVKILYSSPQQNAKEQVAQDEEQKWNNWKEVLQIKNKSTTKFGSRFSKHNNIYHTEAIAKLHRKMGIEDIHSILNSQLQYTITYTDDDAWYTQNNTPPEQKNKIMDGEALRNWAKGL